VQVEFMPPPFEPLEGLLVLRLAAIDRFVGPNRSEQITAAILHQAEHLACERQRGIELQGALESDLRGLISTFQIGRRPGTKVQLGIVGVYGERLLKDFRGGRGLPGSKCFPAVLREEIDQRIHLRHERHRRHRHR
jgi:hypothetical protein